MYSRVALLLKQSQVNTINSRYSSNDSLNVSRNARKVVLKLNSNKVNTVNSNYFRANSLNLGRNKGNRNVPRASEKLLRQSEVNANSRDVSGNTSEKKSLVEVLPMFKGQRIVERIEYTKIREYLNLKTLKEIAKHCCLLPVDISEDEEYFTYQYPKRERIYISKKTWRLYAEVNNEHSQFQAYKLLRYLAKFGYVEGFKRIQKRKTYNIGW